MMYSKRYSLFKKYIFVCLMTACILFSGCGRTDMEAFSYLQKSMETESPYLLQEDLEEQLKLRLDELIYLEGGADSDSPLLSYKDTVVDYIVLHQKAWDSKEAEFTQYIASILLQPRDETLNTTMVSLTVYNESLYSLSLQGSLKHRIDFGDSQKAQEGLAILLGSDMDLDDTKIWYQGTLTVDGSDSPEYPDFDGKDAKITDIHDWAENFLKLAEIDGDAAICIRNFREEDSATDILIESRDADSAYLLVPYYFYQENNFQKPLALDENKYHSYIEKLEMLSIN